MKNSVQNIAANFAYLKDVLGIKYLKVNHASDINLPSFEMSPLQNLGILAQSCTNCPLSASRNKVVFGEGAAPAKLMFVGEGPGDEEDKTGSPFVGPAGQLLTKMISAMGLTRGEVYLTNVVKCRPPENRNPETSEVKICESYLSQQMEMVNPTVVVALGAIAAQSLLGTAEKISQLRGKVHSFKSRKLIATFHPAYLLRNPLEKKAVWEDLQVVMKLLK